MAPSFAAARRRRKARHGCCSGKDGPQIVRIGDHRIGPDDIETFLSHLAATCNASLSAELTGFSREAFYHRRRGDPALDRRWRDAVAYGYGRIEELVLRTAEALLEGRPPPPDSPLTDMTMRDAIHILQLYRGTVTGKGKAAGWTGRPRSPEERKASILRKLNAIERHRRAQGGGGAGTSDEAA
jgi:hypothetical protein